jgi:hypothetical protein
MRTWTATAAAKAHPEAVLHVLTDPDAASRWAPVPFDVEDDRRLAEATGALLNAGALQHALSRLTREAALSV